MRSLTVLAFILLLFSCSVTKNGIHQDDITGINYIVHFPLVQGDRKYIDFGDTTSIYFHKDLIIYQLSYTFDSSKVTYHVKADSISEEHLLTETRYAYFVYRHGSHNGIWYKSFEQLDSTKRLSVDSLLSTKAAPLQSVIFNPNDSLVEKISTDSGDFFTEKYIPKTKPDESYNDTTLLRYSRTMKPIHFSLSPCLDSMNKAKLCELRLMYNEGYSQKYSITMPKRDILYKIEQLNSFNTNKLKTLLERFNRDERKIL